MRARRILLALICIVTAAAVSVLIIQKLSGRGNMPPDPGTPVPDPHKGTFSSEAGSFTFSGDGKSIDISVSDRLAGLTGLPSGDHSGTYQFLSGDIPPNGSVPVRYDVAHELEITVEGKSVVLEIGVASADGKSSSVGWNTVTETEIPLLCEEDGKYVTLTFSK